MCATAAYQSLYASPQTPNLSLQRHPHMHPHALCLSFTDTLYALLFFLKHAIFSDNISFFCYAPSLCKITTRLNGTNWKPDRCPYHIWSIATCCVLKNERLYLKHERRVCFPPLFILVDFPWGIVMPVSVDTLIEMCEVKTIVYINARDLCSTIIGLSPSPRDYTGFKWKNGFLQYNTEGF